MRKSLLVLLMACTFVGFAQKNKGKGLLWEITGNGLKSPSYLYGTMHVSKKIAFHLSDTFFLALDQVDLIALESDPGKWMSEMYKSKTSMTLNGYREYVRKHGSGNFYENLTHVETPKKDELISALRKNHALQNGYLYRSSRYNEEYEENTYLDLFIYQYAKKKGKEVLNLENYEETNRLEIMAMKYDEEQIKYKKMKYDDPRRKKRKKKKSYYSQWDEDKTVAEAMQDAYREGDIQTIDSISTLTSKSKNYLKFFLYERNRIMAEGIDSLMKHKRIFIGIGAAHLAGDEGVISMLEKKGYTLRPVVKKITKFAKDKKNKMDEFFLDIPYKKFTTKDGYITLNSPDTLYETPGENGELQYFFPDMINGGYFFVARYPTFAPFFDKKPKDYYEKVDSLLFENIKGKILSQEKVTISGHTALDVKSKTRKGDHERRLIVFTPLEIIVFKVAGTGEWAKKYGDRFIKSIKINNPKKEKFTFASHLNDFNIEFPQKPISNIHATSIAKPGGYVVQSLNEKDSAYYIVFQDYLNSLNYMEEDSFEVVFAIETFFDQFDSLETDTAFIDAKNPKLAHGYATFKSGRKLHVQAFQKKNMYFVLSAMTEEAKAKSFFNSFKWTANYPEKPMVTFVDTSMKFKVKTNVIPNESQELYREIRHFNRVCDDDDWQSLRRYRFFFNETTLEGVSVYSYKYPFYYHVENLDTFWSDELDQYDDYEFVYVKKNITKSDTLSTAHVIMGDTNTTKVIEVKKFLKGNILYTIKVNYDSLHGKSNFVKEFFNTFEPLEQNTGKLEALKPKNHLFFADINSTDSLRKERAYDLYRKVNFKEEDIDSLIWVIEHHQFPKKEKEKMIEGLLKEVGYLKSPKNVPYLVNKYSNVDENYKQQIAILKALTRVPSKKSYKQIKRLLIDETPIASSSYTINSLFYYLEDTLKLTKKIFPEALDLLLYSEYKKPVLELCNMMLDSNMISPKIYKRQRNFILREAKKISNKKVSRYRKNKGLKLKDRDYTYIFKRKVYYPISIIDQLSITPYLNLLAPYYKSDKRIKKYFDDLVYTKENEKTRLAATVLLAKNGIMVRDSIYKNFSKSVKFSIAFYKALDHINRLDLFDKEYKTQEFLMKSTIFCDSRLDPEKDTLTFVKKAWVDNGKESGYLYFFTSDSYYGDAWYVHYAGLQPKDSTKINVKYESEFIDENNKVYTEEKIQEEIDETVKYLRLVKRERAYRKRRYYFDY